MTRKVESAVEMVNIVKQFPGVLANNKVDFDLKKGEVHALLGENGAGKSTLVKILYGLYRPDAGKILLHGEQKDIHSPADAIMQGIGMIPQEFILVPVLRVIDNVVLGTKQSGYPLLDLSSAGNQVIDLAKRYGWHIDPWALINDLSLGEQQRVEIIKAVYRKATILIMDEPTSVLTPHEVVELRKMIRQFIGQDGSVVFISHKLDEVMEISDRITVMRDGQVVGTVKTSETNKNELARMMVGREIVYEFNKEQPQGSDKPVLEVENIEAAGSTEHNTLKGVSFTVNRGEIFGIAGVDGNGQRELAHILTGLSKDYDGEIRIFGDSLDEYLRNPHKGAIAYVPEDRKNMGLVMEMSVRENLVLRDLVRNLFNLSFKNTRTKAVDLWQRFDIRTKSIELKARHLSGGNQQRVILARETGEIPALLIAVHPTQGLDIAAAEGVYKTTIEMSQKGVAVVYISNELKEILTLTDRFGIMSNGKILGIMKTEDADLEEVGLLMGGATDQTKDV
jgi:simple sugar transport system ATP-binding protein